MSASSRIRSAKGLCCSCAQPAVRGSRCNECHAAEKARAAKRYKDAIDAGLCGICKKNPRDPASKASCSACLLNTKERQGKLKATKAQQLIASGVCTRCKKVPATAGYQVCEACLKVISVETEVPYHTRRREAGLCSNCPAESLPGKSRCQVCQERHREKRTKAVQAGNCISCFSPVIGAARKCSDCQQKLKDLYQSRKLNKQCVRCGDPVSGDFVACLPCSELVRQSNRKKHKKLRKEVIKVYGGKCQCPGCDVTEPCFLEVDHKYNDGAAHRRELGIHSGAQFYSWLRKNGFPQDRFQLMCGNCNRAKGRYGYCPHTKPLPDVE